MAVTIDKIGTNLLVVVGSCLGNSIGKKMERHSLQTSRLELNPFLPAEAAELQAAINDRDIAAMTRSIEYPYTVEMASAWIATHDDLWQEGKSVIFAIRLRETGELVGAIGLEICELDHCAELGYWVAKNHWGNGIATEAAAKAVEFGFEILGLNRITAHHMTRNPASGRVLEKLGMLREGLLRKHARKWGEFYDVAIYGLLAQDWENQRNLR